MSLHKQGDRLINSLNWTELVKPTRMERDEKESDGMHGRFVCEPLERGFGTTIGNALRRVLLSSLQGAAFTSVKINNVQHEFSTIHGVLEDVTDIILNLKQVRMAIDTEEPQKLELHVNKKGAVQAGMVQENQHVVVLNPEQHICTLTEDVELDMELEVRTGKGYVPARHDDDVIGVIPLDASFSPIRRVSYEVQAARVGQMTNYDKLILEVWTDGSVKPEDAIAYAAKIIKEQISVFINFDEKVGTDYGMGTTGVMDVNPNLFMAIDELELSVRAANCLRSANISIVGELVQRSENEMLKTKNFGRKSLDEIKEHLLALGLDFGMKIDNFDKKYQEWKKQKEQQNEA